MKYRTSVHLDRVFCGSCIGVTWPGFTVGVATEDGANALAGELNRLADHGSNVDRKVAELQHEVEIRSQSLVNFERDLRVQIDAKLKFIRKSEELERDLARINALCEERGEKLANQAASIRTFSSQRDSLVTAIRESQKILADYLGQAPSGPNRISQRLSWSEATITDILGVLDHRDLVTLVNEIPSGDSKPGKAAETYTIKVKADADGRIYASGFGVGVQDGSWIICNKVGEPLRYRNCVTGEESSDPFPKPFVVDGEQVYINEAMVCEATVPVVNNTTNHFAPEPKASKKQLEELRKATEYFEEYAQHESPGAENKRAAKHLRKLLKKLS